MHPVGFSTGSLAGDDVSRAVALARNLALPALELSALRLPSLAPLVARLGDLEADLAGFAHVSFHAPSRFSAADEPWVTALLDEVAARDWPIVVHPDALHDRPAWRRFGPLLAVENMDLRKPFGQTAEELRAVFADLPEAGFCFDLGHARQVDPTLGEAERLAFAFADRLAEIHLSHVDERSAHHRLTPEAAEACAELAPLLGGEMPVILECPMAEAAESELREELRAARTALAASSA